MYRNKNCLQVERFDIEIIGTSFNAASQNDQLIDLVLSKSK